MSYQAIKDLVGYALRTGLIEEYDRPWAVNELLKAMGMDAWEEPAETHERPLEDILKELLDDAAARGLYDGEVPALRVNFEARIMGAVMPRESETAVRFEQLRQTQGVRAATDYFYGLCIASNYIRTAQIAKNIKWD